MYVIVSYNNLGYFEGHLRGTKNRNYFSKNDWTYNLKIFQTIEQCLNRISEIKEDNKFYFIRVFDKKNFDEKTISELEFIQDTKFKRETYEKEQKQIEYDNTMKSNIREILEDFVNYDKDFSELKFTKEQIEYISQNNKERK